MIIGILEISKMNPESCTAGKNARTRENWAATNWLLANVDTSSPIPRQVNKNSEVNKNNDRKDPRKGVWKTKIATTVQKTIDPRPRAK